MRWPRCLTIPRPPDFVIGGKDDPYMRRWWVIPRNKKFNVYLHHFLHSDDDRALHDHPWWNVSVVLWGFYLEHQGSFVEDILAERLCLQATPCRVRLRRAGMIIFRKAELAHRIELIEGRPSWTLFITGPVVREWGFHCPKGWRHWREFTDERDKGAVGKGCE